MSSTRTLALLAVLFVGGFRGVGIARAAEVTAEQAAPSPAAAPTLPWFGMMVDAGVPDGAQGSIVLRPTRWLRTSLGGGYNLVSKGVRGGLSILPFGRGPSLTVEGGRFFDGDANAAARMIVGAGYKDNAIFERVGYDYANAHLGLDIGYKRVTFFVHAGMSYIHGKVHNLDRQISTDPAIDGTNSSGTQVSIKQDPTIKGFTPSAKLGFIVYLW